MTIQQRLDSLPLGGFHYRLVVLSGLGWLFDSMDSLLMALALPALPAEWGLGRPQRATLLVGSMLGMLVGAALAGTLADRVGRQRLFRWTLLLFSVATGLCSLARGFRSLLVLRFLVGLGLGGELPVASSLVSEFSPAAHRGRLVVLLESFWSLGALVAAAVALLIPTLGWRFVFLLGATPALYVLILRRAMPESPRFLLSQGKYDQALAVLRDVEARLGAPPAPVSAAPEPPEPRVGVPELLARGLRRRTLVLWGLWFGMVYSYYGIFTWLPSLIAEAGHTLVRTYQYTLLITLAQVPGYFAAAALVDRLGRRRTLLLFLFPCALASLGYAASRSATGILVCGSLISFFNLGAWGVVYTYTPELYPTRVRATGAGWASAFGRLGGILAPYAVSAVLDATGRQSLVFAMFAGVILATALVAAAGEETRGLSLEAISDSAQRS
jgi:putative MFS transporter